MAREIEVRAVVNAFDLAKAEWEFELDVAGSLRIMCELFMWLKTHAFFGHAKRLPPIPARFFPLVEEFFVRALFAKELHLHLLELARAEEEILCIDLVAEALADLTNTKRYFLPRRLHHVQ